MEKALETPVGTRAQCHKLCCLSNDTGSLGVYVETSKVFILIKHM